MSPDIGGVPSQEQVTKFFLKSKQVWGAIAILLVQLNVTLPFSNDDVAQIFEAVQVIAGAGLFLWGMFSKDRRPLGLLP